jgi:integrase
MATINFYLHQPTTNKETSIMLHFLHGNAKLIYSTGQKIHPKDWNKTKQRCKNSFKQASNLNSVLDKFEDEAFNGYRKCILNSDTNYKESVRNHLNECIKGVKTKNNNEPEEFNSQYFLDYLDLMITESKNGLRIQKNGKKIASATFGAYHTLRHHIVEYEKYTGKRITIILQTDKSPSELKALKQYWNNWYASFLDYCYTKQNLYDNAAGNNIKVFNTLWNYMREVKLLDIGNYQQNFRVFRENIQVIALEPHHLSKLINNTPIYNSLSPTLKKIRDSFLFGCTVGLRIKDLKALTKENLKITNDGIYIVNVSSKTNTETSVKLPLYCVEILERYKEIKNTKKLLPICKDQRFNYYIKDVCKAYGFDNPIMKKREQRGKKINIYKNPETKECHKLYELVSSHTMRRTAITSLLRLNVPERVVKSISGHCSSSKDFDRYVAYSQQFNDEKSDAAFEKLLTK